MHNISTLVDKKIGILGYGVNNQALVAWLLAHDVKDITICDKDAELANKISDQIKKSNVQFQLGDKYLDDLSGFDIIFRTPGISYLHPKIQEAKEKGVEISSQTKLFFKLCPAKIIGVTGTKGKGTTSTLIMRILSMASKYSSLSGSLAKPTPSVAGTATSLGTHSQPEIYLAGNIGADPFEFLDKLTKDDWVILELSSFQLHDLDISPHIAVILNITSDHLDYHKDTTEYIEAKTNIVRFQKQDDYAVINLDYLISFRFAEISPTQNDWYFSRRKSVDLGAYISWNMSDSDSHWGEIILRTDQKDIPIARTYDLQLRGEHNLENICAAITASYLAGADIETIKKVVMNFKGLSMRLELVWEDNGVKYYNDSASTNPDTTVAAIKSFSEKIVLIAGGSSKGADYTKMGEEILNSNIKTVILMGKTAPRIESSIINQSPKTENEMQIINVNSLEEAVRSAKKIVHSGDVVVFSPASASFDMFRDYRHRGEEFNRLIRQN